MHKINLNIKNVILLLVLVVVANIAIAQPGQNTVIIQGVYTPTIDEANKINVSPSLIDTVYKTPDFTYNIMERRLATPFKVVPIKPAKLLGEPLNKLYSNYVAAGIGNYTTPYFEFYHSNLRSRSSKFGVHLKHLSSAGKINDYAFPGWSENLVEIYGSKFWKKSIFESSVSYKRDVNHAYGFIPANYPDSIVPADVDFAQRYNYFDATLNWYRYRLRAKEMNYSISTKYYFLQDFYHNSEHSISAKATLDWNTSFYKKFKNERLGFEIQENFFNNINDTNSTLSFNYSLLQAKFWRINCFYGCESSSEI